MERTVDGLVMKYTATRNSCDSCRLYKIKGMMAMVYFGKHTQM